jgi:hypothetical protein
MTERAAPIVVKLGKASKKSINRLKDGEGPLVSDIQSAVAEVRAQLGLDAEKKEIVPVVLVYRRKKSRRSLLDL